MYKYLITDTYKLEFNFQLKKNLKLLFRTRYPYSNVYICATLCNDIVC